MSNKLTECDDCGGKVSKRAATCPHCGAPLTQTVQTKDTKNPSTQRKVPSGNLINCRVCGADRANRQWKLATFCPACGDKLESIEEVLKDF